MKNSTTSTTDQKLDKILIHTIENTENIKEMSEKLNNIGANQEQHTLALDGLTKILNYSWKKKLFPSHALTV